MFTAEPFGTCCVENMGKGKFRQSDAGSFRREKKSCGPQLALKTNTAFLVTKVPCSPLSLNAHFLVATILAPSPGLKQEIQSRKNVVCFLCETLTECGGCATCKGANKEGMATKKKDDKGKTKEPDLGAIPQATGEFNAARFGSAIHRRLPNLFNNAMVSDIRLKVGEEKLHCHRAILCAWSDTFNSMLSNRGWGESELEELPINVEPSDFENFKGMIEYMYKGTIFIFWSQFFCRINTATTNRDNRLHHRRQCCGNLGLVRLLQRYSPQPLVWYTTRGGGIREKY